MRKIPFCKFLFLCPLLLAMPLQALDLKFTSPNDLSHSLEPVIGPATLSVFNEEGGFLRFHSEEKLRYCQMGIAPNKTSLQQGDGEIDVTFRFGAEKQSFGVYLRVGGAEDAAYLALASAWTNGQGTIRLFKVPPKAQVEDQHQIAKETLRSPLTSGSWYTLKIKTAAQGGQGVQLTAELVPATGGAATTATAVDPNGLKTPGGVNLRFYTGEAEQNIDVKQIVIPSSAASASKTAATPAIKPAGR